MASGPGSICSSEKDKVISPRTTTTQTLGLSTPLHLQSRGPLPTSVGAPFLRSGGHSSVSPEDSSSPTSPVLLPDGVPTTPGSRIVSDNMVGDCSHTVTTMVLGRYSRKFMYRVVRLVGTSSVPQDRPHTVLRSLLSWDSSYRRTVSVRYTVNLSSTEDWVPCTSPGV